MGVTINDIEKVIGIEAIVKRGQKLLGLIETGDLDFSEISEKDLLCIERTKEVIASKKEEIKEQAEEKKVASEMAEIEELSMMNIMNNPMLMYKGSVPTRLHNLRNLSNVKNVPQIWQKDISEDLLNKIKAMEEKKKQKLIVYGTLKNMKIAYPVYNLVCVRYHKEYVEYLKKSDEERNALEAVKNNIIADVRKKNNSNYEPTLKELVKKDKRVLCPFLAPFAERYMCELYFLSQTTSRNRKFIREVLELM